MSEKDCFVGDAKFLLLFSATGLRSHFARSCVICIYDSAGVYWGSKGSTSAHFSASVCELLSFHLLVLLGQLGWKSYTISQYAKALVKLPLSQTFLSASCQGRFHSNTCTFPKFDRRRTGFCKFGIDFIINVLRSWHDRRICLPITTLTFLVDDV